MSWALGYELDQDKMVQYAIEDNLRPDLQPNDESRLFMASLAEIQQKTGYKRRSTLCIRDDDYVEVFTLRLMNPRGPRDFEINTEKVGSLEQFGKLLDMLGVARLPVWYVVLTKDVGTEVAHPPGLKKKELVRVVDKYMGGVYTHLPWRLQELVRSHRAKRAAAGKSEPQEGGPEAIPMSMDSPRAPSPPPSESESED